MLLVVVVLAYANYINRPVCRRNSASPRVRYHHCVVSFFPVYFSLDSHWELQFSKPKKGPKSEENAPPPVRRLAMSLGVGLYWLIIQLSLYSILTHMSGNKICSENLFAAVTFGENIVTTYLCGIL